MIQRQVHKYLDTDEVVILYYFVYNSILEFEINHKYCILNCRLSALI